jgi:hypothetical protein
MFGGWYNKAFLSFSWLSKKMTETHSNNCLFFPRFGDFYAAEAMLQNQLKQADEEYNGDNSSPVSLLREGLSFSKITKPPPQEKEETPPRQQLHVMMESIDNVSSPYKELSVPSLCWNSPESTRAGGKQRGDGARDFEGPLPLPRKLETSFSCISVDCYDGYNVEARKENQIWDQTNVDQRDSDDNLDCIFVLALIWLDRFDHAVSVASTALFGKTENKPIKMLNTKSNVRSYQESSCSFLAMTVLLNQILPETTLHSSTKYTSIIF